VTVNRIPMVNAHSVVLLARLHIV